MGRINCSSWFWHFKKKTLQTSFGDEYNLKHGLLIPDICVVRLLYGNPETEEMYHIYESLPTNFI